MAEYREEFEELKRKAFAVSMKPFNELTREDRQILVQFARRPEVKELLDREIADMFTGYFDEAPHVDEE